MAAAYPTMQTLPNAVEVTFHFLTPSGIEKITFLKVKQYVVDAQGVTFMEMEDQVEHAVVQPGWIAKTQPGGGWVL